VYFIEVAFELFGIIPKSSFIYSILKFWGDWEAIFEENMAKE